MKTSAKELPKEDTQILIDAIHNSVIFLKRMPYFKQSKQFNKKMINKQDYILIK